MLKNRFFSNCFHAVFLSLLLLAGAGTPGCTSKKSVNEIPAPQIGKAYYSFEPADVNSVQLAMQVPGTDAWSVRLQKDSPLTAWKIASAPIPLKDDLADETYLLHLLDTLLTLTPSEEVGTGPLATFGLESPWVILKWKTSGREYELRLGAIKDPQSQYMLLAPTAPVLAGQGAALKMLDYGKDWRTLRKQKLFLWKSDDVDEVALVSPKPARKLVRLTPEWETPEWEARFEKLMHQRILRFIVADEESRSLDAEFKAAAPQTLVLKNRQNKEVKLDFWKKRTQVFARSSERPGAWLEVYPDILESFKPLTQAAVTPRKSSTSK